MIEYTHKPTHKYKTKMYLTNTINEVKLIDISQGSYFENFDMYQIV